MADNTTPVDPSKRYRVKVVVPAREGYPGFWAAGQLWGTGETETELDGNAVKNIQSKPGNIAVVVLGEASSPASTSTPSASSASSSDDEDSSPSKSRYSTRK